MIEIFYNKKRIYLTDQINTDCILFKERIELKQIVFDYIENQQNETLCIFNEDINELYSIFKSLFKFKLAAGGLVINPLRQVLAIKVENVWQLPKGHVEVGETVAEAAIREVAEETSIDDLTIIEQLPSTFHIFVDKNNYFLKQTYWFKMTSNQINNPKPQKSENIQMAIWVKRQDIEFVKEKSYLNLSKIWDYAY